jgi:hypothetical protein
MRKKGRSFDLIVQTQTVPFQAITDCLPRYFTKPMHTPRKNGAYSRRNWYQFSAMHPEDQIFYSGFNLLDF